MRANELIQFGAVELARLIRHGQVDPIEVVDAHIGHIQTVNPLINALVTATFDEARLEAVRVRRIAKSKVPDLPLLGVPITVKDALAVAGVRFTAGSTFYRDNIAGTDAESVRRLRAAGAIVLGKTNCPDMSASTETTNVVFGLTRNPWNPDRSALEIFVSDAAGGVTGSVQDGPLERIAGATVVLIPDSYRLENRALTAIATTTASGQFVFRGVAPGPYRLLAFERIPPNAHQNLGFIRKHENRGHAVEVKPGGMVNVDLTILK
jgi:hypothetical protein